LAGLEVRLTNQGPCGRSAHRSAGRCSILTSLRRAAVAPYRQCQHLALRRINGWRESQTEPRRNLLTATRVGHFQPAVSLNARHCWANTPPLPIQLAGIPNWHLMPSGA
jgi:hypothetical protein